MNTTTAPTDQEARDYAAAREIDCPLCGHGDADSMAREGCPCCKAVQWHDPSGRGCALAGRVIAGDVESLGDACKACLTANGL